MSFKPLHYLQIPKQNEAREYVFSSSNFIHSQSQQNEELNPSTELTLCSSRVQSPSCLSLKTTPHPQQIPRLQKPRNQCPTTWSSYIKSTRFQQVHSMNQIFQNMIKLYLHRYPEMFQNMIKLKWVLTSSFYELDFPHNNSGSTIPPSLLDEHQNGDIGVRVRVRTRR